MGKLSTFLQYEIPIKKHHVVIPGAILLVGGLCWTWQNNILVSGWKDAPIVDIQYTGDYCRYYRSARKNPLAVYTYVIDGEEHTVRACYNNQQTASISYNPDNHSEVRVNDKMPLRERGSFLVTMVGLVLSCYAFLPKEEFSGSGKHK